MVNQRMPLHLAPRTAGAYLHTEAILLTNQRETHAERELIAAAPALLFLRILCRAQRDITSCVYDDGRLYQQRRTGIYDRVG